jgi:hypothetical protein
MSHNYIQSSWRCLLHVHINLPIWIYEFKVNNHLHESWRIEMYPDVGQLSKNIAMGIIHWNITTHCSHAWSHTFGSSKLMIIIISCHIEARSLNSWLNNKNYGGKDAKEACQLNLYPIVNHSNCKSQFQVWFFWSPYFHKPHFTICTILLVSPFASKWFHEVVWWSISDFSHNLWNSHGISYFGRRVFWLEPKSIEHLVQKS